MVVEKPEVTHDGRILTIDGKSLKLELPIINALAVGKKIIVVFDVDDIDPDNPRFERNVVCLDGDGRVVWHIERRQGRLDDGKPIPNNYVGFEWQKKQQKLVAYDNGGLCFDVDLETGNISNPVFTK